MQTGRGEVLGNREQGIENQVNSKAETRGFIGQSKNRINYVGGVSDPDATLRRCRIRLLQTLSDL